MLVNSGKRKNTLCTIMNNISYKSMQYITFYPNHNQFSHLYVSIKLHLVGVIQWIGHWMAEFFARFLLTNKQTFFQTNKHFVRSSWPVMARAASRHFSQAAADQPNPKTIFLGDQQFVVCSQWDVTPLLTQHSASRFEIFSPFDQKLSQNVQPFYRGVRHKYFHCLKFDWTVLWDL